MFPKNIIGVLFTLLLSSSFSCKDDAPTRLDEVDVEIDTTDMGNDIANNAIVKQKKVLPSRSPRVKFKGGKRWAKDLQISLDLKADQLCNELSTYDCISDVHHIALGGVDPYALGIDKPIATAPVTAPIAVDRIALQACDRRASLDLKEGESVLFDALKIGTQPSKKDFEMTAKKLYDRLLRRDANDEEIATLVAFAEDVKQSSTDPVLDWAMLSCFMVASSTEALFY